MDGTKRLALALILNIAIVVGAGLSVFRYCKCEDGTHRWPQGSWKFKFFTTDSNVLAAVAALIVIPFEVSALVKGTNLSFFPIVVKYIGTTPVTLTFFTVLFFLGPTQGYKEMFSGVSFYMHFLGAAFAVISFCFLEKGELGSLWIIPAMIPMIVYTFVYKYMVMTRGPLDGGWEDFYGFNVRNRWKKSAVIMTCAMLAINFAVLMLHNK